QSMGSLPQAGQWTRLEIPASKVGLEGKTVSGMAFTLYGGQAWFDSAGKTTSPLAGGCMTVANPPLFLSITVELGQNTFSEITAAFNDPDTLPRDWQVEQPVETDPDNVISAFVSQGPVSLDQWGLTLLPSPTKTGTATLSISASDGTCDPVVWT